MAFSVFYDKTVVLNLQTAIRRVLISQDKIIVTEYFPQSQYTNI